MSGERVECCMDCVSPDLHFLHRALHLIGTASIWAGLNLPHTGMVEAVEEEKRRVPTTVSIS